MRLLRTIAMLVLCALLTVGPDGYAQQKKATTAKTTQKTTQRKKATPQRSTAKTPAKTSQKSTAKPAQKPAANATQKSAAKPAAPKATTNKPQKRLSRAEYEKQQKDLQKQIAATELMISDNDKSLLSQSRDIKLREDEIGKRKALLVSMQLEIESIRQEEDSLRNVIVRLKKEYQGKQEKYAAAVRHLYKWRSGYDEWLFVLSARDVTESFRRMRYLRQYSRWREQEAHLLAQQRMATEAVQEKLVLTRQDREQLYARLQKERDALARKQQMQEQALNQLKNKQKELKAELAKNQKKQKEIQNMINQLIAEERKKAQQQRQNASSGGSKKSDSKNAGSAYYSPAEVTQLTGSFRQNKGKMPYPVDSNYAFLSHYSKDGNYSITLSTTLGAHACAIFEGTVQRVAKSSEDFTVIISHGEYMSVYSNLSACHVSEGQKVKMRQSIGKVKSDIDGRRAELMFWIYGKSEAENPELWLKK
ncbi:MAG: peptidoglycan DD-metalloendopeptidase family protein [Bacteroidales bacterium]|nr:peptidoglycan DD-metalloendopeptidase family protein [Bacteroidales bacterium]